jgi:WD40 repeat protein
VEAQGGYVERALWPQPDMAYLRSANTLFPVTVPAPGIDDPPTLGEPFEIGAPGSLLDFAADGSAVAAQGEDGTLALYDLQGSRLTPLDFPTPYFVNFSPNGEWLAVGSQTEREVHVFRTADGEETAVLRGFESAAPVYAAALSPDGQTLLWWARATIQVQDVASGVMGPHFQYQDFVSVFTVSADSRTLAVAVMESIYVYDLSTGMEIDRITLSRPARSLAFSPDGHLLAAGLGPGVQLFDTATWAPLPALGGEGAAINLVSFAPDGRAILAVDEAYQVRVWWK